MILITLIGDDNRDDNNNSDDDDDDLNNEDDVTLRCLYKFVNKRAFVSITYGLWGTTFWT